MNFISHRGNIEKIVKEEENTPNKIVFCIEKGYDVEIDVWVMKDEFFLGHDNPQYKISEQFLIFNKDKLWCHAKNNQALIKMLNLDLHCFWHQNDDYTLTSKNKIWVFPNQNLPKYSVAVLPEISSYSKEELYNCGGICSDVIEKYKNIYGV
jgi:hypothetical protein